MILQPCAEGKCVVEDVGRCLHGWFAQRSFLSLPVEGETIYFTLQKCNGGAVLTDGNLTRLRDRKLLAYVALLPQGVRPEEMNII